MIDLIKNAIANLKGHKLRVGVTIFWIIIGVSTVIVIGSLGNGAKKEFRSYALKEANTQLHLRFYPESSNLEGMEGYLSPITYGDVLQMKALPHVKSVEAEMYYESNPYGEMKYKGETYSTGLYPVSLEEKDPYVEGAKILYGRHLTKEDVPYNRIVLNFSAAWEFDAGNMEGLIGKAVEFQGKMYEVIGILDEISSYDKRGYYIYNPLENDSIVFRSSVSQSSNYQVNDSVGSTVSVYLEEEGDIRKLEEQVIGLLTANHQGIQGYYGVDFDRMPDTSETEEMIQMLDLGVYGVILAFMFISGLGVMNIMYVSVVERKREIGIRRAIGASPGKIVFQFIVEASVITMAGCVIGIILGSVLLIVLKSYLPFPAIPTFLVYFQSIISSLLTGIIFGFIPAKRAAKIDPIEAIRG